MQIGARLEVFGFGHWDGAEFRGEDGEIFSSCNHTK
jgi:hypothetical protein